MAKQSLFNVDKWFLVDISHPQKQTNHGTVHSECVPLCLRGLTYTHTCLQNCCMHTCYALLLYITCNEIMGCIFLAVQSATCTAITLLWGTDMNKLVDALFSLLQ